MLCGGKGDPTVFFNSTEETAAYFIGKGLPVQALQVLDVDSAAAGPADPYAPVKAGFAQLKSDTFAQAKAATGSDQAATAAVAAAYHGSLVPPFCNVAARGFFQSVLAQAK
jgi:hypothetical protein